MKPAPFFLFVFLSSLLLLNSCIKYDLFNAFYTLSNNKPHTGEVITVTDVTPDADVYEWFVDGVYYSNAKTPSFIFHSQGPHTIKLSVKKGKKKSGFIEKQIQVHTSGKVIFWQSSTNFVHAISLYFTHGGSITSGLSSAPYCGDSNGLNFTVTDVPAVFNYSAYEQYPGTRSWNGQVFVTENGCSVIELQ